MKQAEVYLLWEMPDSDWWLALPPFLGKISTNSRCWPSNFCSSKKIGLFAHLSTCHEKIRLSPRAWSANSIGVWKISLISRYKDCGNNTHWVRRIVYNHAPSRSQEASSSSWPNYTRLFIVCVKEARLGNAADLYPPMPRRSSEGAKGKWATKASLPLLQKTDTNTHHQAE
jgi:hypothetical protein